MPGEVTAFLVVAAALAAPAAGPAAGQEAIPLEYAAAAWDGAESERVVEVDGVLDEPIWLAADPIALPFEAFPGSNAPAPVATVCRAAYDARALYFGCAAEDPEPESIRAYISDRDDLDGQDAIVLGLSPFDDGRRAFVFGVNALGVQGDGMYVESRGEDGSWDAIWESAGRIVEDGYVVELSVPFRSLRFPDREGAQSWAFYVERYWPRSSSVRLQSFHENEDDACRLCQVNRLTGLEGITPGRNVQLTPTVSASRTDARPLGASAWDPGSLTPEAGLDVAWGVTTDVTLNATINPDFSQVEADAAQLDANRRFALFYPERRPFFQEGADLFAGPMDLVFTRTITDPDVGAKVTGKVGGDAFGALVARDAVNALLFPGPFGSAGAVLEHPVTAGMGVYRRDVSRTATAGGLLTVREGAGYHNRVGAADLFFRPLGPVGIQLQAARSDTRYPSEVARDHGQPTDRFRGSAMFAEATLDNRAWVGSAGYRRRSPGFRADAGFTPWTDQAERWVWLSRRWFGTSSSRLSEVRVAGGAWRATTVSDGELVNGGYWGNLIVQGPGQSRLSINPNVIRERFEGRTYDLRTLWLLLEAQPTRWLSAELTGQVGDAIDYANARPADQLRVEPAVTFRPGRRVDVRLGHGYQRLEIGAASVLEANVAQARLVYSFSPRLFVRGVAQYRHTRRTVLPPLDPVAPVRESALAQLLFSYKVNPQTVVFLGYADDRRGLVESDRTRVGLARTGRTFFLKVGYALRP